MSLRTYLSAFAPEYKPSKVRGAVEDLFKKWGEGGNVWQSLAKQTLKTRHTEGQRKLHSFRSFGQLLY